MNPILLIGGFGVNWQFYRPLQSLLEQVSRRRVFIAPIALFDWVGVALTNEYTGLLRLLDEAVVNTLRAGAAHRLTLVCHSAGGVLARIYMGDQPYGRERVVYNGFQRVAALVTLGTPHCTVSSGRAGGLDQIMFAQRTYPGAYWRFIPYITVMGRSIYGVKDGPPPERGAYQSYSLLAGRGDLWGDGVVPLDYGMLDGARQLVLDGLRHDARADRPWYGQNQAVVESWWSVVAREEAGPTRGARRG